MRCQRSAAQKEWLERLGQSFSCSGTLSRSKAGRLTFCRQAVPACFGEYRGKLATYALTIAAQKKRLERLGPGFFLLWDIVAE
jgi:hypothetical protein